MNPVLKNALYNLDSIIIGLPTAPLSALGAGFAYIEEQKNPFLKTIGLIGHRTCNVINTVLGLPLLVYNVAKAIFANLLNAVTFNQIEALRDWAEERTEFLNNVGAYVVFSGLLTKESLIPQIKSILGIQQSIFYRE